MSLREYNRKRNFQATAEPAGKATANPGAHRFVIQKHAASRLHYDFRLEMGGTLKSWAVPKGMPYAKGEKRLAVAVEDHPVYEIKLDGFRTLAFKNGKEVRLLSRNEKDFNRKFPQIQAAVGELTVQDAIIDGEIVALDPKGRSSFQLLQAYDLGREKPPLFYYAFDLLRLEGKDLQQLPLKARKALLQTALADAPEAVRQSLVLQGDVKRLLKEVERLGLEGLIGKRADSVYEPGKRSGAWVKLKLHHEQEMVIGGFQIMPEPIQLDVNGVAVNVSNLNKIFYPRTGFTKGQVIDYYIRVSDCLLPHLKDRPITLKRYPNGVEGLFFYEKQCPASRPEWVETTRVAKSEGGEVNYCLMNDLPALVWAANLADLELHTFLHKPHYEPPRLVSIMEVHAQLGPFSRGQDFIGPFALNAQQGLDQIHSARLKRYRLP